MRHLDTVLNILSRESLYAKESQCDLGLSKLLYLGHIINARGVHMDPKKICAIIEWPTPVNLTQLRGFLGLSAFYIRFISGYSRHVVPLMDLMRKGAFLWTLEAYECFDKFKELMTSCPVLALPYFSKPFELHCDTSGEGVGAVLMQDKHPISYESRKLGGG